MNTRTVRSAMLATGLLLALIATTAACGSDTGAKASADQPTTSAAVAATEQPVATPTTTKPAKPAPAHVGDSITLHGTDDGSEVSVTLIKWVDPAKGADEYTTPAAGKRFVAAQVRVTNTGTAVYDDSPANGMQAADSEGQRFESSYMDVSAGPSMVGSVKLNTGDKALGYISFEVPKTSNIASVQFTMDSGFADESGQWSIR